MLMRPTEVQNIVSDYKSLGMTLERHPIALLRKRLTEGGYVTARRLKDLSGGRVVKVAGLVIGRQRPGTATGVTFVTLEDETGCVNLVVWRKLAEEQRNALLNARLMGVVGELQSESDVIHVIARQLIDHTDLLGGLTVRSRDFR